MKNTFFTHRMTSVLAFWFTLFQKLTRMKLTTNQLLSLLLIIVGTLLHAPKTYAQDQTASSTYAYFNHLLPGNPFSPVQVKNSEGTVCNDNNPVMYNHYIVTNGQPQPGAVSWNDSLNIVNTAKNSPIQNRFKATAGKPTTLTADIYVGRWPDLPNTPTNKNNEIIHNVEARIGTLGGAQHYDEVKIASRTLIEENTNFRHYRCEIVVNFNRGATTGYVVLTVPIHSYTIYDQHTRYEEFVIPFLVSGVLDPSLPLLGTTEEPSIPYLVLHRPPGDLSSSSITTTTSSCRRIEENITDEQANTVNASVKLGVKGSAGIFVSVDYEIYAEFTGSASLGSMQLSGNSTETCLEITNTFSTQDLAGGAIGSDIFVGYSRTLDYGVFPNVAFDGCSYRIDTSLIFITRETKPFSLTKDGILADIIRLEQVVRDSNTVGIQVSAAAQYQIDLWNEVLVLNEANINNPDNVPLPNVTEGRFSGGTSKTYSTTLGTTDTRSLTVQHFLEGNAGLQGVVNVAGSGFSAGYNFQTKKTFGQSTSNSQTSSTTISYTLADDDAGDLFVVDKVVADPMYGTPVFILDSGSRTSCPYESGYQRDQPKLKHHGQTDDHIVLEGIAEGTSAIFQLDLCNESNEKRNYYLKLNAESNLPGAIVTAAGPELNGNDRGQLFSIDPNSCLENLVIEVKRQSTSSPLAYPNLEIFLYADCEEDVQSSVFASVYFGTATSTNEVLGDAALLSVFPNPTTGLLRVELADHYKIEHYLLTDITGKTVQTSQWVGAVEGTDLDLSTLPKGIYVLQVRSEKRVFARKVMVQ